MTIFNIPTDTTPESEKLAIGFLRETNVKADNLALDIYDGVQRFWYRNADEEGNPSLEGDQPTGIQILQAMGTNAQTFLAAAYARVEMLLTIQEALGVELIDLSKASAPYDMTFNQDGSLATWTLKE